MRLALAVGLAAALAVGVTAAAGKSSPRTPRGFSPEAAAAVGTRDYWVLDGHVLLRSTDGGRAFGRVAAPPVAADGTVPTIVFANRRDGFAYTEDVTPLFVTHDGGSSWHRAGPAADVAAFSAAGGYAYALLGRHRLERSPAGRDAWLRLALSVPRLPASIAARGSDIWLLGPPRHRPDFDTVALSSDRGRTFTPRKGPCLSELGGTLVPAEDAVVWAICPTGNMAELALSKNGGRSFPTISSFHDPGGVRRPSLANSARIAAASARVAVVSRGSGGALVRTTDAGRHWRPVAGTARFGEVSWLAFTTRRAGAALVQMSPRKSELWRTTDGGVTWHSVPVR